jgi:D-alanyl-D-alanine carboxypeptidase
MATIPYLGTTLPPMSTMVKYFGPLADPSQEVTVPFAGKTLQINRVLADNARQLGDALKAAGFASYIRDVGGFRTSKGASGSPIPFSMHQFGAAFDINEDGGPNGNWQTMTLPRGIVNLCASYHWFCGENWSGASRDGGHFQFTGGDVAVSAAAGGGVVSTAEDLIAAALAGAAIPAGMVVVLFAGAILLAAGLTAAAVAGAAYVASRQ